MMPLLVLCRPLLPLQVVSPCRSSTRNLCRLRQSYVTLLATSFAGLWLQPPKALPGGCALKPEATYDQGLSVPLYGDLTLLLNLSTKTCSHHCSQDAWTHKIITRSLCTSVFARNTTVFAIERIMGTKVFIQYVGLIPWIEDTTTDMSITRCHCSFRCYWGCSISFIHICS